MVSSDRAVSSNRLPADATSEQADPKDSADPRDARIAELRYRLEEASQQFLQVRDALFAAEAELSVATTRATEVEHHLHLRILEVTELRNEVEQLKYGRDANTLDSSGPNLAAKGPNPAAQRFSPLLGSSGKLDRENR